MKFDIGPEVTECCKCFYISHSDNLRVDMLLEWRVTLCQSHIHFSSSVYPSLLGRASHDQGYVQKFYWNWTEACCSYQWSESYIPCGASKEIGWTWDDWCFCLRGLWRVRWGLPKREWYVVIENMVCGRFLWTGNQLPVWNYFIKDGFPSLSTTPPAFLSSHLPLNSTKSPY